MAIEIQDMTFEELGELATNRIHSALLEGGGKAMKFEVHVWLDLAIRWDKKRHEKQKKAKG